MPATDILILTASTGGGHDSVAAALAEALRELAPGCRVRILDALSGCGGAGPLSLARWYDATVAHVPQLWGFFYHVTNNPPIVRLGMAVGALVWARGLRRAILVGRPGIVVAVHPLCARLAADVLRAVPAAPPLHCVVTDLVTIHRCWACEAVAAFYVATPDARAALIGMGIPRERVRVTGLPLRAAFTRATPPPDCGTAPRVLVLGGGHPRRRVERIALALAASRQPLRLVVVCGRNTRLRRRLARALGARVTVLGWCDEIAALMRWSSVVVTRGGPTTLAEAASQARPVVVYEAFPGQEEGNVALVERSGAGRYIPEIDTLVRALAASSDTLLAGGAPGAAWWGGSARRVAERLLAARANVVAAAHLSASAGGHADAESGGGARGGDQQ